MNKGIFIKLNVFFVILVLVFCIIDNQPNTFFYMPTYNSYRVFISEELNLFSKAGELLDKKQLLKNVIAVKKENLDIKTESILSIQLKK